MTQNKPRIRSSELDKIQMELDEISENIIYLENLQFQFKQQKALEIIKGKLFGVDTFID